MCAKRQEKYHVYQANHVWTDESMKSRPTNASTVRIIAVDGLDRNAVHGVSVNLRHR